MVLASEAATDKAHAVELSRIYGKRWCAEEATRARKDRDGWGVGLDKSPRSLTLRGMERLVRLNAIVYLYLAKLRRGAADVLQTAVNSVKTVGPVPKDLTYRVMRGLRTCLSALHRTEIFAWLRRPP